MHPWKCKECGYEYNPIKGDPDMQIPAGTSFERIPNEWDCPICGAGKQYFREIK
jgi:rubredoxin